MNQGKLEVVKQEMARVNVDILGISELKWTGWVKSFSYKQEKANTERLSYPGGPHGVLLYFNPSFSSIVLNFEGNRYWTRKGIMFLQIAHSTVDYN